MLSSSVVRYFAGKIVLITGASSGIGKALAETLIELGAQVINADVQMPAVAIPGVTHYTLDVSDYKAFEALFAEVIRTYGRVDVMINNAGIGVAGEAYDLSIAQWEKVMQVNLLGVVYGTKLAYDHMVERKQGHIVNIASMAGLMSFPLAVPYACAKHGVVGLSKALRVEAKGFGVRVTAVCPGFVESSLYENAIKIHTSAEQIRRTIPFPLITTQKAVFYILKGIARDKSVLVFPLYTRAAVWLERLLPGLTHRFLLDRTVYAFRRSKQLNSHH